LDAEDPVSGYLLIYGRSYIEFERDNVIHIRYSNPNFNENGEHLYGISPLKAALRNIESTNEGLGLNIKTLKSGGAFGLIHAKSSTLTKDQADSIKERLLEMDSSSDRLAKIAGVSAEIGFTRLSLTSDELKPFDYFKFDKEQIADCLQWEIVSESRGDFGGTIQQLRKQRVTDNIQPDLKLLEDALNNEFLPRFKGYEDSCIVFDCMELPEMQSDVKEITEWLNNALDRGVISRNEYREAIQYMTIEDNDYMDAFTVTSDIIGLEDALDNDFNIVNGTIRD
jgi:HK97 family phage portal protein